MLSFLIEKNRVQIMILNRIKKKPEFDVDCVMLLLIIIKKKHSTQILC